MESVLFVRIAFSCADAFNPIEIHSNMKAILYNLNGQIGGGGENIQTAVNYRIDVSTIAEGNYILTIENGPTKTSEKIIIKH